MDGWIAVARLMRPQGRRGELLTEPMTDLPDIFVEGRAFGLGNSQATQPIKTQMTLEESWQPQGRQAGRLVLKLAGVDSISEAEALAGQQLFLRESDLPALAPDTFLVRDLVGCALWDEDHAVGTVVGLEFPIGADGRTRLAEAADLLVVAPLAVAPSFDQSPDDAAEPVLVPFVQAWLVAVDLAARRITMRLPPGLFSAPDPADDVV